MSSDPQIVLVTGGRTYSDAGTVATVLGEYAEVGNILIQGAARGADRLAARFWFDQQLPYVSVPAPWDRAGRAAGPMRSISLVRGTAIAPHAVLVPDIVIAFPGGPGTAGTVQEAERREIPVRRIR